jgi:RNA recognition motif-containing protein
MGFVTFTDPEAAQAAIKALHNTDFEGRPLIVEVAKPPRSDRGDRGGHY